MTEPETIHDLEGNLRRMEKDGTLQRYLLHLADNHSELFVPLLEKHAPVELREAISHMWKEKSQ